MEVMQLLQLHGTSIGQSGLGVLGLLLWREVRDVSKRLNRIEDYLLPAFRRRKREDKTVAR